MEKCIDVLSRFLVPLAEKLQENRYLKSIGDGFSMMMGPIMVGAIFTLLANLQIAPYQSFVTATHLKEIFAFVPTVTTDMFAIYAVVGISLAAAKNIGIGEHRVPAAALSLLCFLLMIPLGISGVTETGEAYLFGAALPTQYLGAAGLFTSMILGMVVPTLYKLFIAHDITIKMPPQVPPMISRSFSGIVPSVVIAFLFAAIRFGVSFTDFGDVNTLIYTLLKTPIMHLGASPFTFIIMIIMCSLLWFFGLHGGLVVMPILSMLYMQPALENLSAFNAGEALPNIIVNSMWSTTASLGGAGGTIGLCIFMTFFAKAKRYRTLGKLALPAGICGINEPVTFGLPVVLNPIILPALVITPIVTFSISYALMYLGIIPLMNGVAVPLGTPVVLAGFLANGWQFAILQVILVAIQFFIYLPFAKILDREALKEEAAQAEAEAAEAAQAAETAQTA